MQYIITDHTGEPSVPSWPQLLYLKGALQTIIYGIS